MKGNEYMDSEHIKEFRPVQKSNLERERESERRVEAHTSSSSDATTICPPLLNINLPSSQLYWGCLQKIQRYTRLIL